MLNLMKRQEEFKVIYFQIDKKIVKNQHKVFEGVTRSIEKFLKKSDDLRAGIKKDDDMQRSKLIQLQDNILDKLDDLKRDIGRS